VHSWPCGRSFADSPRGFRRQLLAKHYLEGMHSEFDIILQIVKELYAAPVVKISILRNKADKLFIFNGILDPERLGVGERKGRVPKSGTEGILFSTGRH
jgi:hypothetical protein